MRRTHVKQFVIIDSEEEFRGIICLSDLLSLKVGEAAAATGLRREDLTVLNVMTARQELRAIDMRTLCSASIGDVLETMQTYGHRHVLVVDQAGGRLRGIVSAADIADALHMPVTIESRANTFADIFRTVKH
jgi:DeoR family transcriptional regulator, catabolite repression regulator